MKRAAVLLCVVGLCAGFGAAAVTLPQQRAGGGAAAGGQGHRDPLKVGGSTYKLVLENERVRAMEVRFAPGQSIGLHDHPDHLVYVLAGGKLKITREDGQAQEPELKEGQALWIPAEAHKAANTGDTEVRLLVVELREPSHAAASGHEPDGAGPPR